MTTCVGLTVFNLFSDIDIKKRSNAQNWILTSAGTHSKNYDRSIQRLPNNIYMTIIGFKGIHIAL
jgi:hypothetical protein